MPAVADNRRMPPKRKPTSDDPRGQLGAYLRHLADKRVGNGTTREQSETDLADSLGISRRTLRAWFTGRIGPTLGDLDNVAEALGFDDWGKLGNAVTAFSRKMR